MLSAPRCPSPVGRRTRERELAGRARAGRRRPRRSRRRRVTALTTRRTRRCARRELVDDAIVCAVPPGHAWARRGTVDCRALSRPPPMVVRDPSSNARWTVDAAIARAGLQAASPLAEAPTPRAALSEARSRNAPVLLSRHIVAQTDFVVVEVTGLVVPAQLRARAARLRRADGRGTRADQRDPGVRASLAAVSSTGSATLIVVPSVEDVTSSPPCSSATRSRMPVSPKPSVDARGIEAAGHRRRRARAARSSSSVTAISTACGVRVPHRVGERPPGRSGRPRSPVSDAWRGRRSATSAVTIDRVRVPRRARRDLRSPPPDRARRAPRAAARGSARAARRSPPRSAPSPRAGSCCTCSGSAVRLPAVSSIRRPPRPCSVSSCSSRAHRRRSSSAARIASRRRCSSTRARGRDRRRGAGRERAAAASRRRARRRAAERDEHARAMRPRKTSGTEAPSRAASPSASRTRSGPHRDARAVELRAARRPRPRPRSARRARAAGSAARALAAGPARASTISSRMRCEIGLAAERPRDLRRRLELAHGAVSLRLVRERAFSIAIAAHSASTTDRLLVGLA